ncbi:MAG: hypothetical protein JXQ96_18360 [Cyclobacteriaceae bacterium]
MIGKFFALTSIILLFPFCGFSNNDNTNIAKELEKYNVIWKTPSENQNGSMPLGNGDIGINVWAQKNGDLLFYISKNDAWTEYARLSKVGKVRVHFDNNPFKEGTPFIQKLDIHRGEITINSGNKDSTFQLKLWLDANNPLLHIETESKKAVDITVSTELWRDTLKMQKSRIEVGDMFRQLYDFGWETKYTGPSPYPTYVYPDVIAENTGNQLIWYHHNQKPDYDPYEINMRIQSLDGYMDKIIHPLRDRIFGALIEGDNLVYKQKGELKTENPVTKSRISIIVHSEHPSSPEKWIDNIRSKASDIEQKDLKSMYETHWFWWKEFWSKSWIFARGKDVFDINRGYCLQRFKNACAGRGEFPIKFNGSLFSLGRNGDPDFMKWGSTGFWFQNQRHIYWPMLASGDFELMKPWFDMYKNTLEISRYRTSKYFNHAGAHFPETILFWGAEVSSHYNWTPLYQRNGIEAECSFVTYYWQNGIEQTLMMLDYYLYTKDKQFARETLLPMAESILDFFYRHYPRKDGKLYISPGQALETFHQADNPTPELAGLKYALEKLIDNTYELMNFYQRHISKKLLNEIPDIPIGKDSTGVDVILPAYTYSKAFGKENAELYSVFPYRIYGVNKPELQVAKNTFDKRVARRSVCWSQDAIQMAYLGLTDEIREDLKKRANSLDEVTRFPAFWESASDWKPDEDNGGGLMNAFQAMIVQAECKEKDRSIILFPTWPADWDLKFKLHAPLNTTIEGELKNGKIKYLNVTPKSREKDIIIKNFTR